MGKISNCILIVGVTMVVFGILNLVIVAFSETTELGDCYDEHDNKMLGHVCEVTKYIEPFYTMGVIFVIVGTLSAFFGCLLLPLRI